ncbi:hypothetical protein Pcinc_023353 [Petrolisthes cinctipes]|uniref:Uncharacterized protein n=1 Tax=Petrolisthes cinctipes TaxID=88211 RepID=A0AAE1FCH6_PETCI|nr:hypothetical protein Pcinc_023353 [Petrolisthes cinctipes]
MKAEIYSPDVVAGSASPCGSIAEVTLGGSNAGSTTHLTAQVVVANTSATSGGGTNSSSTSSSTSTSSTTSATSTVSLPKGTIISTDPLIIGTVSEGDGSLDSPAVHGAYVQAYPVYTVGDTTMYSAGNTYYQPGSTTPVSYSQEVANSPVGGQILASGGNTYVIQPGIDTAETHPIINSRASPQTVSVSVTSCCLLGWLFGVSA